MMPTGRTLRLRPGGPGLLALIGLRRSREPAIVTRRNNRQRRSPRGVPWSRSHPRRKSPRLPPICPRAVSCVDGPRLARNLWACSAEVACSHVSARVCSPDGLLALMGSANQVPHHSNGIDVPMKRQVWLGCVGSTDCAITRHCSLASSRTWLSGLSRCGHALVVLMPVHHRPGDARGLVG